VRCLRLPGGTKEEGVTVGCWPWFCKPGDELFSAFMESYIKFHIRSAVESFMAATLGSVSAKPCALILSMVFKLVDCCRHMYKFH
jgi:hypothetical protein